MRRALLLSALLLSASGCGGERPATAEDRQRRADSRRLVRLTPLPDSVPPLCEALPDTVGELARATYDEHDFPDARVVLDPNCPTATLLFLGGARIPRSYHVAVPNARTLLVRVRGERAGVVLAFDGPPTAPAGSAPRPRLVTDSIRVETARDVAVRVMLSPLLREEPSDSRILVSFLVRP